MKTPKLPFKDAKIEYDNKNYAYENMVLHLEPEQKESHLNGTIIAERLKVNGLSSSVLDYLLENTKEIPKDWKGKYVYFWGTIFRYADGRLYVRCLVWDDGKWQAYYDWLDDDFDGSNPAAVSASMSSDSVSKSSFETMSFDQALEIVKKAGCKVTKEKLVIEEL